ncbi:MAG: hypothetical protein NTY98_04290 [Verrucomicrobia bacterium]|nr:hypothetical protein [Verrucomicrobiota bacterium]
MTLHPITTKQFIAWAVLITLAFILLVINQGRFAFLFIFPFQIATFVTMPADDYKRPMPPRQVLVGVGVGIAIVAVIGWLATHATPESDAWARSFGVFIRHPGVAVPLWLLFLYLGYRRWRVKLPLKESAPHSDE